MPSEPVKYTNINGKLCPESEASIAPDNRSFRYGYGLFETILVEDNTLRLRELHWQRLFAGMRQLSINIPQLLTADFLENEVLKTVKKNKFEKCCRVRLQVYAGNGGLFDNRASKPGFVIECYPLDPETVGLNENGLVLGFAQNLAKSKDMLSNLKSSNALIYAIAAQQAMTNRWNDALLCNTDSFAIESSIANIFWVKEGLLYTPPLDSGCVAGVMRQYIIDSLNSKGINVSIENISATGLLAAEELFLTNAIRRIKWVSTLNNKQLKHDLTKHVHNLLFVNRP